MVPVVLAIIVMAPCPAYLPARQVSCYDPPTNTIYLLDDASEFEKQHEQGHAYDYLGMTDKDRKHVSKLIPHRGSWRTPGKLNGWQSGEERFADGYAACATGKYKFYFKREGYKITRLCNWLERRT